MAQPPEMLNIIVEWFVRLGIDINDNDPLPDYNEVHLMNRLEFLANTNILYCLHLEPLPAWTILRHIIEAGDVQDDILRHAGQLYHNYFTGLHLMLTRHLESLQEIASQLRSTLFRHVPNQRTFRARHLVFHTLRRIRARMPIFEGASEVWAQMNEEQANAPVIPCHHPFKHPFED